MGKVERIVEAQVERRGSRISETLTGLRGKFEHLFLCRD